MPIRGFPNGVVACFDEPNSIGDIEDFNASRNGPAKNPGSHLPRVFWHSDFFQYELLTSVKTVTIDHAALDGREKYWGPSDQYYMNDPTYTSDIQYRVPGRTASAVHTLYQHNLGYEPLAFVSYNGSILMPGVAVQIASDGRNRFVSVYVTTTSVLLREVYNSAIADLSAVSRTYKVLIFKRTQSDPDRPLFGKEGNNVVLGRGKVDTSKQYLRRVGSGDTPFDIDKGPTIDINNGRTKIVTGGVATTEAGYGGSFSGPSFVSVGV